MLEQTLITKKLILNKMAETDKDILRGGQFLVKETKCEDVFTPEDFSEEQKMMKESVMEFNDREIIPHKDRV